VSLTYAHHILIVDDELEATAMLSKFLTSRGYGTQTAANGGDALELVLTDRYDVVMTDLRMPGMDGADFLARIRVERPALPVIVMTGHTTFDPDDSLWTQAGITSVLNKPLNLREVSEILRRLLA
jgi:DNA-binding NtrC family response regulator